MTNELAQVGQFCPNETCELYGEIAAAQIIRFGKTRNGTQRYRCKSCGQTFTETYGTVFYRRQATRETILETLALLAEGVRISSISRAKGIKEDTILDWLRAAARQAADNRVPRPFVRGIRSRGILWFFVRFATNPRK
jgi:predicted RNA-binding Zn-ribbon protein involved in translation (DUF1610 family)